MALTANILFHFFMILSLGMVAHLPFVNMKETGVGFFRLVYSIAGISCLLALGLCLSPFVSVSDFFFGISSVWLIVLFISFFYMGKLGLEPSLGIAKGLWFLELAVMVFYLEYGFFKSAYLFISIFHFGSITFAMILGHYYLVVPRLSEKPLLNLHYEYWVFLIFKLTLIGYFFYTKDFNFSFYNLYDSIMISMRILWGPLAIFVLSIFSYKLSKMRSTQSATGVLYVETFFMISSELIALYYFVSKGWLI